MDIRGLRLTRGSGWKVTSAGCPPLALEMREGVSSTLGEAPAPQAPSASLPDEAPHAACVQGGHFQGPAPCPTSRSEGRAGREGSASIVELGSRPRCTYGIRNVSCSFLTVLYSEGVMGAAVSAL